MTNRSRQQDSQASNTFDFVATQVGLLESRAVSERTAQDLNLANNPDVVSQDVDASLRLRAATNVVQSGLKVPAPEEGQLIKFTYDSTSPPLAALVANGIADSFINSSLQRRYEASAYARNFLERQIAKTRGDLERSERSAGRLCPGRKASSPPASGADGKSSGNATPIRCRENRSSD